MRGLVLSGTNNVFAVLCEDGEQRHCAIKGKRIKDQTGAYNALAAGDRVEVEPGLPRRGMICSLEPRMNVFGRYNEKGRARQAIAANVDLVACVASPALPPFRPRFVDRVAVLAEAAHVPLLIALNKFDLGEDEETSERLELYESLGYSILRCSASTGGGVAELAERLRGRTSVLTGQSGVGKSSLLNAIDPELSRRVGEVSEKYARGKHTTTMAELICLGDGATRIIDTPGVRRLALRGIEPGELDAYFPELAPLAPQCEFGLSCTHRDEEGCRIARAVREGTVHEDRYESYLRIRWELEANREYSAREGWSAAARRGGGAMRGDGARKSARARGGDEEDDDD
jgi:ribosome biogenesis GTPase / thiamine phosphate phosphatase